MFRNYCSTPIGEEDEIVGPQRTNLRFLWGRKIKLYTTLANRTSPSLSLVENFILLCYQQRGNTLEVLSLEGANNKRQVLVCHSSSLSAPTPPEHYLYLFLTC